MAKTKSKATKKASLNKSTVVGERIGFDISYLRNPSFSGSRFWLLMVGECSNNKWSFFLKRKSDFV
jgi:hypothetical protein